MKKLLSLMLTLCLLLTAAAVLPAAAEEEMFDNGKTYGTGYPITKDKIELDVLVMENSQYPHITDTKVLDYIEEKTNIRLNIRTIASADERAMMFVDRDYPDFCMAIGASNTQVLDAAEAGDLVEIGDLLERFAPTWTKFFSEYKLAYRNSLMNGKLYTLPFCNFINYDRELRDVFFINQTWLNELGLEQPTTTEEFKNVLLAFKNAAGTGTIPEKIYPWHFVFDTYAQGQFDMYNFFGVIVTDANYLMVDDGVVKYQAVNEAIKEPLKYMAELYELGLIAPEVFTTDQATIRNMHAAETPVVGALSSYGTVYMADGSTHYYPNPVLDAQNGRPSYIRPQNYTANPTRAFMMFSNNEYQVATIRLCEFIVENLEQNLNVTYGLKGVYWDYDENGAVKYLRGEVEQFDGMDNRGFWNQFIGIRTMDSFYQYEAKKENTDVTTRQWAWENLYKDHLYDSAHNYVGAALTTEEQADFDLLNADVKNVRKRYFSRWITGQGDIDAEWAQYLKESKDAGEDKLMEFWQIKYDRLMK